jgi:hypothetical protein
VEVLLYIGLAMALAASCQLKNTWCRCCFVLIDWMYSAEDIATVGIAVVEVLGLSVHPRANEGVLLLTTSPPELLFLVRFVVA